MTRLSESELASVLKGNPDLLIAETIVRPGTRLYSTRGAIPVSFESDAMAARFEALWGLLNGPALEKEYRFDKTRRWRFDYAHLPSRIAVEIHGGVWSGGRHVRGGGFLRDREKMNAAQLLGWKVIELGTGQITAEHLEPVIKEMTK